MKTKPKRNVLDIVRTVESMIRNEIVKADKRSLKNYRQEQAFIEGLEYALELFERRIK